jgi:arylsulfatase A-like enzyme/TolA-binding protein
LIPRWVAAAVVLPLTLAGPSCRPSRNPQSVLLVTFDTTRADRVGAYGYARAETETLDALSKQATLFEQAIAAVPVTLPSHSAMMTGLNPYHHGVRYNGIHVLPQRVTTLAERLRDAGFKTGAVVSSFAVAGRFGLNQGFETYDDLFADKPGADIGTHVERRAGDAIDRAIAWWGSHGSDKRFLWVHLYDPHYPYDPPFPYSLRFADRPYDGEIASADHELGRLFATLEKRNDWDGTLVIVAGDHGEGLYEHGERWHSTQVYDDTLHVPLIIKLPGRQTGKRVREPVGLVDITPTVLDYAGLKSADPMDGVSLREAIDSGRAASRPIYFESIAGAILYGWSPLLGVRRGSMKYFEGARGELYDIEHDPGEVDNLVEREAQRASDLRVDLDAFRKIADIGGAGVEAQQVMDEETLAQLASLGYVGGAATTPGRSGQGLHPPDVVDLEQELLRAQTAVTEQKWQDAAQSLDFILRKDPTNRFALHFRSVAYSRAGETAKALELAQALLKIYPDSPEAYDLLGETLSQAGRPADAAKVYAEALVKHGDDPRLRFHRILSLLEAKRIDEAEVEVAALEKTFPSQSTTALARSMTAALRGNVAGSLDALDRAVTLGLHDLRPVEGSPWFLDVRNDPRYAGIATRASIPKSGALPTQKPVQR